jgi:alpha-glucosidase (family GH31 glycosyl hydrolase)
VKRHGLAALGGAVAVVVATRAGAQGWPITSAGQPAQLDVRVAGPSSVRITLKPRSFSGDFPESPAVAERPYAAPVISLRSMTRPVTSKVGSLTVEVRPDPLTVLVRDERQRPVQTIRFDADGVVRFTTDDQPILGMGEGGPRPASRNFRLEPVQFDRRGAYDTMEPRWQSDMYGSRNPVATLVGTRGWALFMPTPWALVDLRDKAQGQLIPWKPPEEASNPQTERNQQQAIGKGRPPVGRIVPGLYDLFVFDAREPGSFLSDYAVVTGRATMPPRWALGYMQSHRTLQNEAQILGIIDTFRLKRIPLDAVIYLGTGFAPRGWNTRQPSFTFNPDVFQRDAKTVIDEMHAKNAHLVVHIVPFDRDSLPTLHGSIPAKPGDDLDASHIQRYWQYHIPLLNAGVDAFWPDEGDWFDLFERLARHRMYYEGPLSTRPNVRPWSLHRNGYPGIAQWGGWVWSGDTQTSWKTLEAQIAVGLNYSLSIGPYWGSDIGGFYPDSSLTGELYARWFQFGAFTGSFRSHGRTWHVRLPWGFGQQDRGPLEMNNTNTNNPVNPNDPRVVQQSEMGNPAIEPVLKKYDELRYQLLPYTYTLAWQARSEGLPLMRALWVHYPDDSIARGMATEYLWGRDILVAPVFQKGAMSRSVYLPRGSWYDWWDGTRYNGGRTITRAVDLATMPIFVRAGSIIPVDPIRQYADEPVTEPMTLQVYPGANADYTLYEDDGNSQEYLRGLARWTRITWNDRTRALTISPAPPAGAPGLPLTNKVFRVRLMTDGTTRDVSFAGRSVSVTLR